MRHTLRHNRGSARAVIGGGHQPRPEVYRVAQFVGTQDLGQSEQTSTVEILNTCQTDHIALSSRAYLYFFLLYAHVALRISAYGEHLLCNINICIISLE